MEMKQVNEVELTYETAYAKLEEIVHKLEVGELTLEESLTLFEDGVKLSKYCAQKLDTAQGKLEILTGFTGEQPKTKPFVENGKED